MADVSKTKMSDRSLNHSTSWSQDPTGKILLKDPLPHHLVSWNLSTYFMCADRGENGRVEDSYAEHGEPAAPDSPSLRGR